MLCPWLSLSRMYTRSFKKLALKEKIVPYYVAQSYLKVLETSSFENSEPEKYLYHPASWELLLFR